MPVEAVALEDGGDDIGRPAMLLEDRSRIQLLEVDVRDDRDERAFAHARRDVILAYSARH